MSSKSDAFEGGTGTVQNVDNAVLPPLPDSSDMYSPDPAVLFRRDFTDEQLKYYLNKGEIRPTEKPEVPPQILWVGDCCIATFGNFSASTGKAKSKKTFNISAMVAAAINNGTVLNYRASLPEGKRKVLYFDTEQSRHHCHTVLERILRLAGRPVDKEQEELTFIGLREFPPLMRIRLIDYALRETEGCGLVIIDGLRDLMYDINNAKEATDVMTMLMSWTSRYHLHIHCVLHLNKNDSNTRGHIGTELENKAETVLMVSKSRDNAAVSEVRPMHMRDKEFAPFAFHINQDGLPCLEEGYRADVIKKKEPQLTELPASMHRKILDTLFSGVQPASYQEMVTRLKDEYTNAGHPKGVNAVKKLLTLLTSRGIIRSTADGYNYFPACCSLLDEN